jgi:chromosome segregation ATPase
VSAATVEDLDRELVAQAAVSQRVIAAPQRVLAEAQLQIEVLTTEADAARRDLEDRTAELASVRAELAMARAELQWLRRAGIDLLAIMDSRLLRALRASGRGARVVARRRTGA